MARPRVGDANARLKQLPRPEPGPLVGTFVNRRYHRRADGVVVEVVPRAGGRWYQRELPDGKIPHYARATEE